MVEGCMIEDIEELIKDYLSSNLEITINEHYNYEEKTVVINLLLEGVKISNVYFTVPDEE